MKGNPNQGLALFSGQAVERIGKLLQFQAGFLAWRDAQSVDKR